MSDGMEIADGQETRQSVCEKHGEFVEKGMMLAPFATKTMWQGCRKCSAERQQEKEAMEAENEKRRIAERIAQRFSNADIPRRFRDKKLSDYRATNQSAKRALTICQAYADRFSERLDAGGGLILCGKPGTGKTHLAIGIANEIIPAGYSAEFTSTLEAIRRVKSTFNRDSEVTESQAIASFQQFDLLIMDEVGVQFGTDTEAMLLFEIINGRYQEMLPTILISNLSREELKEKIGERIVDRMTEGGGAAVAFDWESYRGKA